MKAVALSLLLEPRLATLRDQYSIGHVFWIVAGTVGLLSAIGMKVLFGDVRGAREYFM